MAFMSSDSPESDGLEETLESARRNVRQLEMDMYRVRSDLTRLEVVLESVITRNAGGAEHDPQAGEVDEPFGEIDRDCGGAGIASPVASCIIDSSIAATGKNKFEESTPVSADSWIGAADNIDGVPAFEPEIGSSVDIATAPISVLPSPSVRRSRRVTPSVAASLALHGVLILAIFSITVATIGQSEPTFTTTILDLGEKAPASDENFDLGQFSALASDDNVVQAADMQGLQADVPNPTVSDVIPVGFESVEGPPNAGEAGIDAPTTDTGTMPAGAGGTRGDGKGAPSGAGSGQKRGSRSGTRGGGTGSALFFGTQTKGDRFVFVVDNSASMKGGRFEMALAELVKTVEGMTPRQSFYVIFVSDQPYPMFYPQAEPALVPATPQNKNRLREWLPKAILASGHNREMIKAMDMAAALGPQAVYLLWDGDLKYSDNVRLDVMSHLTATPWNFVVHTIGLGVTSLDGEQNLTAIAQAHHGQYRRVEVPKLRTR